MVWVSKPPVGTPLVWSHPLNRGLVGSWPMWEGAGDRINDISGAGFSATAQGVAQGPTSGWTGGVAGGFGVLFDGVNDYLSMNPRQHPQTAYSCCAWVRPNSSAGNRSICASYSSTAPNASYSQFALLNTGSMLARIQQARDTIYIGRTGPNPPERVWSHIAYTWDGGTTNSAIKIYVNGNRIDTADSGAGAFTGPYSGSDLPMRIGAQNFGGPSDFYAGAMAGVWNYSRCLNADEVRQHAASTWGVFKSPDYSKWYVAAAGGGPTVTYPMLERFRPRGLTRGLAT